MTLRRRARPVVAGVALLSLLLPHRAAAGTSGVPAASHPPSDLSTVGYEARLPDSGHLRFVRASADGSLLFVGTTGGVERSADGGRTWRDVPAGVPGGLGPRTLDLQISPSNPRIVWAAGLSGVFRSADGGLSWAEADTRSDAPGRALGSVLALDPRHPEAAYLAGYRNGGLYRTGDGGLSWQQVIPYPVSGVAIEPASGATIYAVSRTAGMQRSDDHGQTWSRGVHLPSYTGVGEETAQPGRLLAVDGPGGGLYAAMDGGGLMRSTDGGLSWQDLSSGLPHTTPGDGYSVPYGLQMLGGPQPMLYAIVPSGILGAVSGGTLFAAAVPAFRATSAAAVRTTSDTSTATATDTPPTVDSPAASDTAVAPATGSATGTPTPGAPSSTATTLAPQASPTAAPATAQAVSTPVAALPWQAVAANVDALTLLPGTAQPLVGAEAAPSTGLAATVGILGGATLLRVQYRLPEPSARVVGDSFAYGPTPLPYLSGINYEGPNDRPWQMWQDGKWDATLIARDLDAAATAGYRVLRVFVQDPLPGQVLAGQFGHLDTLVALARQRGLRLLISFNDSRDPDLSRVIAVDHAIAAHLSGNPTIFGYDLQNEPLFQDIAGAIYPPGVTIPLLSAGLIRAYGEQVSLKQIRADRAAGKWMAPPFGHMSAEQVYLYLNGAGILDALLSANPDYPNTAVDAHWAQALAAANASLATFIRLQAQAVRSADPARLITIGYDRWFWASLPANEALDFRSIHIYPTARDWSSIHDSLRSFEALRGLARSPLVLGEYGFSTASQSGAVASVQETAMSLYLRILGGSGDFKWVLNDDTVGFNPYENGLGLIAAHGVPKASYYVNREMAAYFDGPHQPGGVRMWGDSTAGAGYLYTAPDALGVSGGSYQDRRLLYRADAGAPSAQLWLDWSRPGLLRLVSTHEADLQTDLTLLAGAETGPVALSPRQGFGWHGVVFHLHMLPSVWYALTYSPGAAPPPLPAELPHPARERGWYILASGHNVSPPLLKPWLQLGGVPISGTPIAEALPAPGGAVQYFQNLALTTQGGAVRLLPLGRAALGGQALPPAPELPKKVHHLYFPATGHNLRGAFLAFWQSTGGAATWGAPMSEEQTRGSQRVQFFTNAEFVWDGTSVGLAPLGARAWSAR